MLKLSLCMSHCLRGTCATLCSLKVVCCLDALAPDVVATHSLPARIIVRRDVVGAGDSLETFPMLRNIASTSVRYVDIRLCDMCLIKPVELKASKQLRSKLTTILIFVLQASKALSYTIMNALFLHRRMTLPWEPSSTASYLFL